MDSSSWTDLSGQAHSIVDLALILGLLLSMLVGLWRGLVTELLSLIGWVVAYFMAQWFGPQAGLLLPIGEPGSRLNVVAGMMVVFLATWLGWALLSWAVRQIVKASGLGGADRLLGALFGLLRGVAVALVLYTLASMTPIVEWAPWQASRGVPWLQVALEAVQPLLPPEVVKFLPAARPEPGV